MLPYTLQDQVEFALGAVMRLNAAAMMQASASDAIHMRVARLTQAQTQPDNREEPGTEGS